jgi:predicted NBD/HSP70 family sugar kinase
MRANGVAGHADMRAANRAVVLELVRRIGPLSRADVAKESGLAKPTASDIMEELVDDGFVVKLGMGPANRLGGRRPVLYEFDPRAWFVVGVDVAVQQVTIALADANGVEVGRSVIRTRRRAGDAMRATGQAVEALLGAHGVAGTKIKAVSVSVVGMVDPASGACTLGPNLGWRDVDIPGLLAPYLPVVPEVHNVLEAVLVAEHLEGAAADVDDAVLLYDDNGVGAAILIGGRVHRGPDGLAGEIGHGKVPGGTERCGCGGIGCLETEVSTLAILRRAGAAQRGRVASVRAIAESSDPAMHALLAEVGSELGHAASWLVSFVNPRVVLLAGGFLSCGPRLAESVAATLERELLPELAATVELRPSALGAEAPVRGALLLALRSSSERI